MTTSFTKKALFITISSILSPFAIAEAEVETPEESKLKMEEIVVTGSILQHYQNRDAIPATILGGEELTEHASSTLGETLEHIPGIYSADFGAGVSQPILRGLSGARVMSLQNGLSSLDLSTSSPDHGISVEPLLADQIEILSGPSALIFGSQALGGAINVVDNRIPKATEEFSGAIELKAKTNPEDSYTGVIRLDDNIAGNNVHFSAVNSESGDTQIPGNSCDADKLAAHGDDGDCTDGYIANSDFSNESYTFGLSRGDEDNLIGFAISTLKKNYGIPPGGHAHGHEEDDHDEHDDHDDHDEHDEFVRVDLEQIRYDLAGHHALSGPIQHIDWSLAYNDYQHDEIEGEQIATHFSNEAWEARVQVEQNDTGFLSGATGLQVNHRDFSASGIETYVPPTETQEWGLFTIQRLEMRTGEVELGGRIGEVSSDADNYQSRDFNIYAVSAAWYNSLNDQLELSVQAGSGTRAPTAEELYSNGAHGATASYDIGNSELSEEQRNHVEFSIAFDGTWNMLAKAYYSRFDDFIYQEDTGLIDHDSELEILQWDQQDATIYGAELQLSKSIGDWEIGLQGDTIKAEFTDGSAIPRMPSSRIGGHIGWANQQWHADIHATYVTEKTDVAEHEETSDAYTLVNSSISWEHDDIFLFVNANNLLDEEIRESTNILSSISPQAGRSLELGVRYHF